MPTICQQKSASLQATHAAGALQGRAVRSVIASTNVAGYCDVRVALRADGVATCRRELLQRLRQPGSGSAEVLAAALALMGEARAVRGKPPPVTDVVVCVGALGRKRLWSEVLWLLRKAKDTGVKLDCVTLNSVVSACSKAVKWQEAVVILGSTRTRGVASEEVGLCSAMSACERAKRWELVLQLLDDAIQCWGLELSVVSRNIAISGLSKSGRWDLALLMFDALPSLGFARTAVTLAAATSTTQSGDSSWLRAMALLGQAARQRVQTDVVAWNSAITSCERGWQWRMAVQILGYMERESMQPDLVGQNAAVSACGVGQQWRFAVDLLRHLRFKSLEPDVVTFNSVSSAVERGSLWQCALHLLGEGSARGIARSSVSWNTAATALGRALRWESALLVIKEGFARGAEVDTVACGIAVTACANAMLWEKAESMLDHFWAQGVPHGQPSSNALNAAAAACDRAGEWERVLGWLSISQMCLCSGLANRRSVASSTLAAAVSACARATHWQEAVSMLEARPDTSLYSATISGCRRASAWSMCLSLLQASRRARLPPDPEYAGHVDALRAAGLAGPWRLASGIISSELGQTQASLWSAALWAYEAQGVPAAVMPLPTGSFVS
ncbi:unnamed protein product [Polarella glacialis]|uniref:Pentatricopeptide repeat-containing protein, chloroplastic n=1 Tax=Polarella glacialis TaxID=89957 RepID=A0A813KXH4_POLGL|nr:unnamed protein product [Polarella glacialis]CAE8714443.1 unnamed protein product [Polarella glacialis]